MENRLMELTTKNQLNEAVFKAKKADSAAEAIQILECVEIPVDFPELQERQRGEIIRFREKLEGDRVAATQELTKKAEQAADLEKKLTALQEQADKMKAILEKSGLSNEGEAAKLKESFDKTSAELKELSEDTAERDKDLKVLVQERKIMLNDLKQFKTDYPKMLADIKEFKEERKHMADDIEVLTAKLLEAEAHIKESEKELEEYGFVFEEPTPEAAPAIPAAEAAPAPVAAEAAPEKEMDEKKDKCDDKKDEKKDDMKKDESKKNTKKPIKEDEVGSLEHDGVHPGIEKSSGEYKFAAAAQAGGDFEKDIEKNNQNAEAKKGEEAEKGEKGGYYTGEKKPAHYFSKNAERPSYGDAGKTDLKGSTTQFESASYKKSEIQKVYEEKLKEFPALKQIEEEIVKSTSVFDAVRKIVKFTEQKHLSEMVQANVKMQESVKYTFNPKK